MRVAFLGMLDSPLLAYLKSVEREVLQTMDPIDQSLLDACDGGFLVSYGYRHIIKKSILDRFPNRAINLHISLLPWNRGADPNLWSIIERTPKGVSIHYIDKGIDTGDIIVQKEVVIAANETLRSSYEQLHLEIQALFVANWRSIRLGTCSRHRQDGSGSFHRSKDKENFATALLKGWDTTVSELENLIAHH